VLRKIITIKNVGRFASYGASGDVELKSYNLIFAENGRGKTTLCAIFRSLQLADGGYVIGRTTLGCADVPEIKILLDSGTVDFTNGVWTAALPEIAIFDATFVAENVHSGDVVAIDHRRSLYSIIVGKRGVDLAKQIDDLDGEAREKNTEIRDKVAAVQAHSGRLTFDSFVTLPADGSIDEKIFAKEKELEAVKQAAQIKNRAALANLNIPAFPVSVVEALLNKTLDGVAADAERRVAEQIKMHNMAAHGQAWISEGVGYIHDTSACPFCGQSLAAAAGIISAYRSFFSQAYNALRSEIAVMRRQIDTDFGDRQIANFQTNALQNTAGVEYWSRFCEITAPVIDAEGTAETLRRLRQTALALLDRKAATPLERIIVDAAFTDAHTNLTAIQQAAPIYNQAVGTANAVIAAKKASTQAADVAQVEGELSDLRTTKRRYEPDAIKACAEHAAALAEKKRIEERKAAVRVQLDEHTKQVIGRYEQTINQLLDDFHAGFRITGTKHDYLGGVAGSSYQILINNKPVDLGDSQTPIHQPSFRNTLSAGDKSTLALAFFLAQLSHDPDKANKIVIFDDPFNSQDSFRKDCTVQKIKKCGQDCTQVIVLSHDMFFLKRIWDRLQDHTAHRKCLELARIGLLNTTICEWDIEKATQDPYRADRRVLTDFYHAADGAPRDVVQKIRPVLETYCKNLGAGILSPIDTLGVIIGKIRTAGTAHQLFPLCDGIEELNVYTSRYHHGENPHAATEPINDTELQGYVRRTLDMTGGC
jgi:wobble nucleotide-excising tRNase